jgi:hypothetical protein
MKMKKHSVLMGLLSVLLMAGLMFSACPMEDDDDDGGLDVPGAGDLPDPGTNPYVATEDEAKALLEALSPGFPTVFGEVKGVIGAKQLEAWSKSDGKSMSYKVENDDSVTGLKINSSGRENREGDESKGKSSGESNTTVDITSDIEKSGLTVYKGSVVKTRDNSSGERNEKEEKGSFEELHAFALTVSSGGKGGKIILEAKYTGKGTTNYESGEDVDGSTTYSGSLIVYGADEKEWHRVNIKDEATYGEALGYFN